jgi:hypothetical protein
VVARRAGGGPPAISRPRTNRRCDAPPGRGAGYGNRRRRRLRADLPFLVIEPVKTEYRHLLAAFYDPFPRRITANGPDL